SILRRQLEERTSGGLDASVIVSETYHWRGDGFRVAERAVTLPDAAAGSASSPEAAVISFYAALSRGDLPAATSLLGDDLRAARSAPTNIVAPDSSIRVEEVRLLDEPFGRRAQPSADKLVAIRVSINDPRVTPAAPEA